MDIDPGLEAAYNVRAATPGHPAIFSGWRAKSDAFRAGLARARVDLAYAEGEGATLDLFPARNEGRCPLLVFLHGGYWQAMDKADFSYLAEPYVDCGVHVAIVNYPLCPSVSMERLVERVCEAQAWLWRQADDFGIDRKRIVVSGHSAGGHLAAMLVATDWKARGLSQGPLSAAVSVSGLFDLVPLVRTSLNRRIGLDRGRAAALSPLEMAPRLRAPVLLAVGERETQAFHEQSDRLAARWSPQGVACERLALSGCDHFAAVDRLGDRSSALFERVLTLAGATPRSSFVR